MYIYINTYVASDPRERRSPATGVGFTDCSGSQDGVVSSTQVLRGSGAHDGRRIHGLLRISDGVVSSTQALRGGGAHDGRRIHGLLRLSDGVVSSTQAPGHPDFMYTSIYIYT